MDGKKFKLIIEEKEVNYFVWWSICRDFTISNILDKYLGSPYKDQLVYFENGDGKWATDLEAWNSLGAKLVDNICNNTFDSQGLIKEHYNFGNKVLDKCREIENKDFSKLDNEYLAKWLKEIMPDYLALNELGFVAVISDVEHSYLSKKLKQILRQKIKEADIQETLNKLIITEKENIFWQEEKELIELAIKFPGIEDLKNSAEFKEHTQKYIWINFGYIGPAWHEADFIKRVEEIKSKGDPQKLLDEHHDHLLEIKQEQEKLSKELELSQEEQFIFQTARDFGFVKNYRVGIRYYFCYLINKIFTELSSRYNIPVDAFYFANEEELNLLILNKFENYNDLLERKNFYCEYYEAEKFITLSKDELLELQKDFIQDEINDRDKVRGQAAFLGKVQGKVKIVSGPKDLNKVEEGDILVAVYTDPNLLPAMKRAAAFVTDQGGITSHAAIVAREMKKPCVIGTKVATKVFEDNDMVEVDANKAIVRKI